MDCRIKRTRGRPNDYDLTLKGLTRGSILALKNALELHASGHQTPACGSPVAADVLAFLVHGIRTSEDQELVRSVLDAQDLSTERITPSPVPIDGPPSAQPPTTRG